MFCYSLTCNGVCTRSCPFKTALKVGALQNPYFEAWSLSMGMGVLGWGCRWMSEFLTSGIVYILIFTISMSLVCLTQFGQKVDYLSFGKNTLQMRKKKRKPEECEWDSPD